MIHLCEETSVNDRDIDATQEEKVKVTLKLAAGEIEIVDLTQWIVSRSLPLNTRKPL
jgi:prophage maintenance system killer protein